MSWYFKDYCSKLKNEKLKDLHRKLRASHIAVVYNALSQKSLKKSGSYRDLPNIYMILTYSQKGRNIYICRNFYFEDKEIELDDEAYKIFLSTQR